MADLHWDVSGGRLKRREADPKPYVFLHCDLWTDDLATRLHRVELTASPTGRRLHVFVDGKPWEPTDD